VPPHDLNPVPLTRREARALENAAHAREQTVPVPEEPESILVPLPLSPQEPPLERGAAFPRRTAFAAQTRRGPAGGRRRAKVARELRGTAPARRASSVGSKFLSLGAMLFAAALLVAVTVPVNALIGPGSGSAAVATQDSTPIVAGQSLQVSADAATGALARDSFDVTSYAQVLALKYAGIDYSYTVTSGAVRWPFPYAVPITDGFGPRDGGFHKGVDFVPGAGTPIYAIADGVATTAGYDDSGYGNHVVLEHNLGGVKVESLYGHMIMDSSPIVVGQQVKVGDFLGLVGETGVAYGAHLHFEIHIDKVPVDPFAWLQANASN
jgi:murein DD-endopeptidase MepM/ murein hydrolase activator NlpD